MALLITPIYGTPDDWRKLFAAEMPELELRFWPDVGNPAEIEAAAVAASMPHGTLKTFPNLRLIVSLLAGAEALLADPELPDVPIVRAGSPDGDPMMNEATLLHVLRHHRHLPAFALAQQRCEWISLPRLRAQERKVGVMGLGSIGLGAARELARHGFQVAGWVNSPRDGRRHRGVRRPRAAPGLPAAQRDRGELPAADAGDDRHSQCRGVRADAEGRRRHQSRARSARQRSRPDGGARQRPSRRPRRSTCFRSSRCRRTARCGGIPRSSVIPHASRRIDPRDLVPRIAEAMRRLRAGAPPESVVDRKRGY